MGILPQLKNRAKYENYETNVAFIIAIKLLHKHAFKIYAIFGIIALLVLCQQSKTWRQ